MTQTVQGQGVGQIAVMQMKPVLGQVRIAIEMIDPAGVEGRGAADEPVHLVALREEQLREICQRHQMRLVGRPRKLFVNDARGQHGFDHGVVRAVDVGNCHHFRYFVLEMSRRSCPYLCFSG